MEIKYNLENGFYWVKIDKNLSWTIMEWDSNDSMWHVGGMPMFEPYQVKYVNLKRIIPPNEQPKITLALKPDYDIESVDKYWDGIKTKWICLKCGNEKCNCKDF